MTLQKNFCNFISAIQHSSKESITAFSKELQISRSLLQEILNGTANPRMDTVEHIANRLQVDPIHLLTCSYSHEQLHVAVPLLYIIEQAVLKLSKEERTSFIELLDKMLRLFKDLDD